MGKKSKILVVDDEDKNLRLMEGLLIPWGYEVTLARSGKEALKKAREIRPDIVLLDIMMPKMDGFKVARELKETDETRIIPIVMVTALSDVEARVSALEMGADDFLSKPVDKTELKARIQSLIKIKSYHDHIREYQKKLESEVAVRKELLEKTLRGSIEVLTDVLGLVNPVAFSKASRLRRYVRHIALRLGLPNVWEFELAAMLSHIGCIILQPETIEKVYTGEPLSPNEEKMYASHPSVGHELLARIPRFEAIASMINRQQESFDTEIPGDDVKDMSVVTLGAQLLKVAIDFDQQVTHGVSPISAVVTMLKQKEKYDPTIVSALKDIQMRQNEMIIKSVNASEVRTGMILAEDVHTKTGVLLACKGQEVSIPVLRRMRSFSSSVGLEKPFRVLVSRIPTPQ
jgi:response regulator RpfG family c-di-GMP phosphodiesterase